MLTPKSDLNSDLIKISQWMICLPSLALWPFLSALPAFSLSGSGLNTSAILLNILLLITGFWPLFLGFIAYKSLLTNAVRQEEKIPSGETGLRIGYYATGWIIIYIILTFSRSV